MARGLRLAAPALIAIVLVAGVATGGYFGYQWLVSSERFAVEEIEVRGTERTSRDRVLELATIAPGDNIFRVGLRNIERALERDPWIREATARRQLPRRLVIDIEENVPAVLVELEGLYLADDQGRVFKRAAIEKGEAANLPIVTGITRAEYTARPEAARAKIRRALTIHSQYHRRTQRPSLGEIHFDPRRGLTLITYKTAVSIRLGQATDREMSSRLAGFDAAWGALTGPERASARVIHLDDDNAPDRVTVAFSEAQK